MPATTSSTISLMIKRLFLSALMLATAILSAQKDRPEGFNADFSFGIFGIYPVQFGDHALAKAHDSQGGAGITLGLLSYNNFSLYGGIEGTVYKVTDEEMIGDIEKSNYTSVYGAISYDWALANKIHLFPDIGYGYAIVKLKSDDRKFGSQDGTEFRVGTTANYYISKSASLFLGVHFIHTSLQVNTNTAYENYFGQANQVQFSAGIKFD
jgi:hypothetical protein